MEISKEYYKQLKEIDPKEYYKHNIQGKEIFNPVLGQINFSGKGLGETIHRTDRKLHPFICVLKELVETGTCDNVLEPLYKPRKDRIKGFYHIKNKVKLAFIQVALDILIGLDEDGNKYYMFKKDSQDNLGATNVTQRGSSKSTNSITQNEEVVNTELENDYKNAVEGETFWISDTIKITILKNTYSDNVYSKLNKDLERYL